MMPRGMPRGMQTDAAMPRGIINPRSVNPRGGWRMAALASGGGGVKTNLTNLVFCLFRLIIILSHVNLHVNFPRQ